MTLLILLTTPYANYQYVPPSPPVMYRTDSIEDKHGTGGEDTEYYFNQNDEDEIALILKLFLSCR